MSQNKSLLQLETTPLVYHFNTLAKNYFGSLSKKLEDVEIERYYFILTLITEHKNITQQCLADCIDIDKANMVRIINYLADQGLVKRVENPEDRRAHILSPTKKAEKLVPKLTQAFKSINKEALKGFTIEETKQFYHMMDRIFENLSGLPSEVYYLRYIKTKKK